MPFIQVIPIALLYLIRIVELLLIFRAILSWVPMFTGRTGRVYEVLAVLTEPLLSPVRRLLWRIPALQGMPIDLSFIAAYILLEVLSRLIIVIF